MKPILSLLILLLATPCFANKDVYTVISEDDEVTSVNEVRVKRTIQPPKRDVILTLSHANKQIRRWTARKELAEAKIAEWEDIRDIILPKVNKVKLKKEDAFIE